MHRSVGRARCRTSELRSTTVFISTTPHPYVSCLLPPPPLPSSSCTILLDLPNTFTAAHAAKTSHSSHTHTHISYMDEPGLTHTRAHSQALKSTLKIYSLGTYARQARNRYHSYWPNNFNVIGFYFSYALSILLTTRIQLVQACSVCLCVCTAHS